MTQFDIEGTGAPHPTDTGHQYASTANFVMHSIRYFNDCKKKIHMTFQHVQF